MRKINGKHIVFFLLKHMWQCNTNKKRTILVLLCIYQLLHYIKSDYLIITEFKCGMKHHTIKQHNNFNRLLIIIPYPKEHSGSNKVLKPLLQLRFRLRRTLKKINGKMHTASIYASKEDLLVLGAKKAPTLFCPVDLYFKRKENPP